MGDNWSTQTREQPKSVFRTMLSVIRMMPHLDAETQQEVIRMVEAWGPRIEAAESGTTLVDDATIRAIVADRQRGIGPSSMVPQKGPSQPVVRGSGWVEPKVEDRSRQFAFMDDLVASMVGGPNDTSKLK